MELIRLLDQYEVSPLTFDEFVFIDDALFLQVDELVEAVKRLRTAACSGDGDAVSISMELIYKSIEQVQKTPGAPHPLQDERLQAHIWEIIEASVAIRVRDDFYWKDILTCLCSIDPGHTIETLSAL